MPSAIFLLIIEPQINGMEATVPVTSRRAYIFLSAGQISSVCPIMATPIVSTFFWNSVKDKSVENPGMDSNLSRVPPVCPKALPLIMGIAIPAAARSGARMREILSPTPPVLCLSATNISRWEKSIRLPECTMISIKPVNSSASIPWEHTAFSQAVISASETCP